MGLLNESLGMSIDGGKGYGGRYVDVMAGEYGWWCFEVYGLYTGLWFSMDIGGGRGKPGSITRVDVGTEASFCRGSLGAPC